MTKTYSILAYLLVFTVGLIAPKVHAQVGSMMGNENPFLETQTEGDIHSESIESVLQDILNKQDALTLQELDRSKLSDDDWERLGDAVMELQHPGQAHEVMDQMMGGEGSESLRQMHINMGQAYLGYGNTNYGPGMMMGGGMMGNWNNNSSLKGGGFPIPVLNRAEGMGFGPRMGGYGASSVYGILGSLTWIALIAFLLAGTYFFIKQAGRK